MTLREYISNPMGKGASATGDATALKEQYQNESRDLGLSGHGIVDCYNVSKRQIVFHFKLPSKSGQKYDSNLHYDIVIAMDINDVKKAKSILDCEMKVFSNCPSFIYTYANLFIRKKMIIPWLEAHYNAATRRTVASRSNPYDVINYERSLYITALRIETQYGSTKPLDLVNQATQILEANLKHLVQTQDVASANFRSAKTAYQQSQATPATPAPSPRQKANVKEGVATTKATKGTAKTRTTKTTKRTSKI